MTSLFALTNVTAKLAFSLHDKKQNNLHALLLCVMQQGNSPNVWHRQTGCT